MAWAPATVAGPGDGDEVGPAAPDLDELGEDRERDLLGGLGAEVEPGRRAQRGEPLVGAMPVSSRSHGTDRAPGSARRRARRSAASRRSAAASASSSHEPWRRDDDVRARRGFEAARGPSPVRTRRPPPGTRSASAIGSKTRDPPAGGRAELDERAGDRASCRRPTGAARAGAVPRRSPASRPSGRS